MFRITAFCKGDFKIIIGRYFYGRFHPYASYIYQWKTTILRAHRSLESEDHGSSEIIGVQRSWNSNDHDNPTTLKTTHHQLSPTTTRISRLRESDDHDNDHVSPAIMGSPKFIFLWFNRCCWSRIDLNLFNHKILSKCLVNLGLSGVF